MRGENLPFSASGKVLVEISLHLGAKTLHGAKRTEWIVQDSYTMTWNEELEFVTELKDIPKAAKLLVVVREWRDRGDKDDRNRTFYWGLLTVFDHRYAGACTNVDIMIYTRNNEIKLTS